MKFNIALNLKQEMDKKKISIYRLSKVTGIRYELLRRVFSGERKLIADELVSILEVTGIKIDEIKGQKAR